MDGGRHAIIATVSHANLRDGAYRRCRMHADPGTRGRPRDAGGFLDRVAGGARRDGTGSAPVWRTWPGARHARAVLWNNFAD